MIMRDQGGAYKVQGGITMRNLRVLLNEGMKVFSASGPIEVDLGEVEDVDSSAVSLLLEWVRGAQRRQQVLRYRNLPANLKSLAAVYGVLDFIPTAD